MNLGMRREGPAAFENLRKWSGAMQIDSVRIESFADGKIGRGATIGDVDHKIGSVFYYMPYAALTS